MHEMGRGWVIRYGEDAKFDENDGSTTTTKRPSLQLNINNNNNNFTRQVITWIDIPANSNKQQTTTTSRKCKGTELILRTTITTNRDGQFVDRLYIYITFQWIRSHFDAFIFLIED
jgi:hypothetical protein